MVNYYYQKEVNKYKDDYFFKILLVGDSYVDKTSLLTRFIGDNFKDKFCRTIGFDFKIKII